MPKSTPAQKAVVRKPSSIHRENKDIDKNLPNETKTVLAKFDVKAIAMLRDYFASLDVNSDHSVSKDEFKERYPCENL